MFGRSGAGKTTDALAFLAQFLAGGSQVYLVDPVETSFRLFLASSPGDASGVSDVAPCLKYVVAPNGATREDFLGKEGARQKGRLELRS